MMTVARLVNKTVRLVLAAWIGLFVTACGDSPQAFLAQYSSIDLVIENGNVVDGLGNPAVRADVVVVGERIVFVGPTEFTETDKRERIARTIDAGGRLVTPGFIDLHSHGDPYDTPQFENFLAMGVTTITLGQDGSSPTVPDLREWLEGISANGIGTNLAMFVGHGTLRTLSGIGRVEDPAAEDMSRMLTMLDDALDYTFGMSSGLEYNPGLNASKDELLQLARIVGENDRTIMSHMRNEDDDQVEQSIAELLDQGQFSRVHIAHLKSVYGSGSERAREILNILSSAREAGVEITADMYPYSASYTGIDIVFPVWAKTDEQFEVAKSTRRDELAEYLRNRVNRRNGPEATLLGTDPYTGKTLAELSFELEMPFEDVLIDIIGPQGASGAYFVMNDELQSELLRDPHIGICSDGSPTGFHPRGHGAFARLIETHVVDNQTLSVEEAIRKVTSYAAQILSIDDRGVLRAGMYADLLVFDPQNVHETATYPVPLRLAEGFDVVILNGEIARENGHTRDTLAGRVLSPTR